MSSEGGAVWAYDSDEDALVVTLAVTRLEAGGPHTAVTAVPAVIESLCALDHGGGADPAISAGTEEREAAHHLHFDRLGMRVYTQGDTAVSDTLVRETPEARGLMLLAQKMNDPLLMLSEEQRCQVLLAGIKCGSTAREHAKDKELLVVVGNSGVGKSWMVNYIQVHGCDMDRVALPSSTHKLW